MKTHCLSFARGSSLSFGANAKDPTIDDSGAGEDGDPEKELAFGMFSAKPNLHKDVMCRGIITDNRESPPGCKVRMLSHG